MARKWFETAEKLEHQNAMDPKRLAKLINDGNSHITIVIECRSSWPHARCLSVSRRIDKWNLLVAYWVHKVKKEALSNSYEKGSNAAVIDFRTREVFTACNRLKEAHDIIVYGKKIRRGISGEYVRSARARCAVKPPRTLRLRSPIAAAVLLSPARMYPAILQRGVQRATGPRATSRPVLRGAKPVRFCCPEPTNEACPSSRPRDAPVERPGVAAAMFAPSSLPLAVVVRGCHSWLAPSCHARTCLSPACRA